MLPNGTTIVLLAWLTLAAAVPARAAESGPQSVARQFCQSDGLGKRVVMPAWMAVAPLVAWSFEPAWDHVVLIGSYEVGSPRTIEDGAVAVEVRYTVIGQVSALGLDTAVHQEQVDLLMQMSADGWRIQGPPLPPHIFAHRVDLDALRQSFEIGALNFVPNSTFVWQLFRSAGWNVPLVPSTDLLIGTVYRAVAQPHAGDLAVYLRDGVPYHVGVFEADDRIVSSTLNAGIVRTPPDAFAGELKYLRLVEPEPAPEPAEAQPDSSVMPVPAPMPPDVAVAMPTPADAELRRATPSPAVLPRKPRGESRRHAQPSKPKRVRPKRNQTQRPSSTAAPKAP